jgi:tripartite-type tricarboxylate transporter receptor subunit TctC
MDVPLKHQTFDRTPMRLSSTLAVSLISALLALAGTQGVHAQAYPSKPITFIVPFPAGGSQDSMARLFGRRLGEELGQPVVVENKVGAGGGIGTLAVVTAPPDGYTLLVTSNGPLAVIPHLYKNAKYTASDLAPIGMLFSAPFFVTVPASSPYKTFNELVQRGKQPNPPMFGSTGSGNASHLLAEMINSTAGTSFNHVPYKGGAPLSISLISGETQWALQMAVDSKPNVDAGKLRALAVLASKRSPPWLDAPTLTELGYPGLEYGSWSALLAPARTPRPIIDLLNQKVRKILAEPEITARLRSLGAEPGMPVNTPEKLSELIENESRVFRKAVIDAKVQAD